MLLKKEVFSNVVENAPLVSIDFIVKNSLDQVLLGKRVNEPALGFWFVPGGRIFKDESLDTAFARIIKDELGVMIARSAAQFQGVYEHFYDNNVFNRDFTTHYIVLAHTIELNDIPALNNQHSDYRWFDIAELLSCENVHHYTKDYFR